MTDLQTEVVVIGAGIVGAAVAMALVSEPNPIASVIVLEAEARPATHQTGHNSGVIHSGLYYRPGTQKAINCVKGRQAMYSFCKEHGIPHERCGKLVVAAQEEELGMLYELEQRGQANGLREVRKMTLEEMREREPHCTGVAALWVPETGIVDYETVCNKFLELVEQKGGKVQTNARVFGLVREQQGLVLQTTAGRVRCKNLINCAGLQSDRIARMCDLNPGLKIVPFRGEYQQLVPERQHLVNNLIYPVPDPSFPFLGVHWTRMIRGRVEAGPNAVLAFKREGYRKRDLSLRDVSSYLFYEGFWKMAANQWKTGFKELYRSFSKRAFVREARRLVPEVTIKDVRPGGSGVRAQALLPDGSLADDFRIAETDRMIHVLNAPSPAATASISIGSSIAKMAKEKFSI